MTVYYHTFKNMWCCLSLSHSYTHTHSHTHSHKTLKYYMFQNTVPSESPRCCIHNSCFSMPMFFSHIITKQILDALISDQTQPCQNSTEVKKFLQNKWPDICLIVKCFTTSNVFLRNTSHIKKPSQLTLIKSVLPTFI